MLLLFRDFFSMPGNVGSFPTQNVRDLYIFNLDAADDYNFHQSSLIEPLHLRFVSLCTGHAAPATFQHQDCLAVACYIFLRRCHEPKCLVLPEWATCR